MRLLVGGGYVPDSPNMPPMLEPPRFHMFALFFWGCTAIDAVIGSRLRLVRSNLGKSKIVVSLTVRNDL